MASTRVTERIERSVWVAYVGANTLGVLVIVVGGFAGRPIFKQLASNAQTDSLIVRTLAFVGLVNLLAVVVGRLQIRRVLRPGLCWLDEGRPPTVEEQQVLYRAPIRIVASAVPWWIVAAAALPLLVKLNDFPFPFRLMIKAESLVVLGFLFGNALAFLLAERRLRPVFSLALEAETPIEPIGLGVQPRFLIVWLAIAGAPMMAIALQPIALTARERADGWPSAFVVSVGALLGGLVITVLASRSVQEPLRAMRAALRQVEEGELDVSIAVADASEIGLVQAGFNRTVQSLRERDRLRELFGHHVGADVAAHALAAERSLGGEVRKVSVLFVDVIASTALSQRQAPAAVVKKLNAFFDVVVSAVEAQGGWVNKFEGDAALCIFGAPGELANHAECALRAATLMKYGLDGLRKRYPDVDAAIAVATGEVVAGNIGAAHRYEYTVIGDAVNEASRLSDEAKVRPERVLATADAVTAAGELGDDWVRRGRKTFRGRAEPTVFYAPGSMT